MYEADIKHNQKYIKKNRRPSYKILEKQGMNVTIRREMGSDIDAACGQLRQNYMNEETK